MFQIQLNSILEWKAETLYSMMCTATILPSSQPQLALALRDSASWLYGCSLSARCTQSVWLAHTVAPIQRRVSKVLLGRVRAGTGTCSTTLHAHDRAGCCCPQGSGQCHVTATVTQEGFSESLLLYCSRFPGDSPVPVPGHPDCCGLWCCGFPCHLSYHLH